MAHALHPGSIDIHTHYFPEPFLKLIGDNAAAYGIAWKDTPNGPQFLVGHVSTGPVGKRFVDLDMRLAAMDEQKLEAHAMSLSQPLIYWAKDDLAQRLTESYNDGLARAHEKHPSRLYGLATLPMQSPELSVKEVARAAKLPGMKGYYISTNVNGKNLSDASFFPVYEAIEATGMPLFIHPVHVLAPERLEQYYLTNLLGNPYESGIAAAHLIFGGVMDRFQRLEVVLPHAGGAFPWLVWRLQRGWEKRQDLKHLKLQGPAAYLRRFHYDTVGYSDHVIDYLVRVVGADRILMGSDYCFPIAYEQPVELVENNPTLDGSAKEAVICGNARKLLKI
jgi:aminocarboxymuconate-semialdehyde decarboxylase